MSCDVSALNCEAPRRVQSIKLDLSGGVTTEGRLFPSVNEGPGLLVLPAMGVNARAYDRFAEQLASFGVTTLVAEHRGGDTSSIRPKRGVDFGYAELLDDAVVHVRELQKHAKGAVSVLGHSLGGQLATVGLSRWYQPGGKLIVIAGGTVHYTAYRNKLESLGVLLGTQLANGVARTLGYFPGHRLGFGGLQSKALIIDWAHAARTGRFTSSTRGDIELELDRHEPEVLAIHVKGDTMAPRSTTEGLIQKLPKARTRWVELEPPAQPKKMNPHFRWLKEPQAAARHVSSFLRGETV
ncbi:MAG: alpha/beta hydrolase [Archangium sp.]